MEKRSEALGARFTSSLKGGLIKKSVGSVASHIFFAQIILVVALFPIFSFQKVEGKMFSPLAFTLGYALLGSLILSLTYVPVMCKMLLNKPIQEKTNAISRFFTTNLYRLFEFSSRYRRGTLLAFICLLVVCVIRFSF